MSVASQASPRSVSQLRACCMVATATLVCLSSPGLFSTGSFSTGFVANAKADEKPAASASVAQASAPPAGGSSSITSATDPVLDAAVRALVSDKTFRESRVSVAVLDVESGKMLASHEPHALVNPASNAKVYTAAAALALVHGNHRYQTSVTGNQKGSSVDGFAIHGHGDPSLETEDFLGLARDLYARGVRKIDGDLTVDQKFFDDQTTPPAFEQQPNEWASFRAPVSALAVNENTVTLTVRPGEEGAAAHYTIDPPGFVDAEGTIKTSSGSDSVRLTLSPSGKRLKAVVSGSVNEDAKVVKYTRRVDDPQLLGGYVMKAALEQVGIKFAGEVKLGPGTKGTQLARHESAPLSQLLYALGKQSDNFYAEMVFKSISSETGKRPAKSQESAELAMKWLQKNGLSDEGLVLKNGSGLFDSNRVTTHSMVALLRYMWKDPALQSEFVAQFAIGGVDGTLAKRFQHLKASRVVRAKTGTLDDVISLSGYVLSSQGHAPTAFSIIFNKVSGKGGGARSAADKLVELIARNRK
jgi:serine-type D-Ala-D-Ala carboxypeptidase/endopeptidase (penicillin-binding protein 4)